jgi:hypothetical protein
VLVTKCVARAAISAILDAAHDGNSKKPDGPKLQSSCDRYIEELDNCPKVLGVEIKAPAYWSLLALGGALWLQSRNVLTLAAVGGLSVTAALATQTIAHGGHLHTSEEEERFESAKGDLEGALENITAMVVKYARNNCKDPSTLYPRDDEDKEDVYECFTVDIAILRAVCPDAMDELADALRTLLLNTSGGMDIIMGGRPEWKKSCMQWRQLLAKSAKSPGNGTKPVCQEGYSLGPGSPRQAEEAPDDKNVGLAKTYCPCRPPRHLSSGRYPMTQLAEQFVYQKIGKNKDGHDRLFNYSFCQYPVEVAVGSDFGESDWGGSQRGDRSR